MEEQKLYKDHKTINNLTYYDENLKDLADLVRNAEKDVSGRPLLKEILLEGTKRKDKKHSPSHLGCSGVNIDGYKKFADNENEINPNRVTEKRICRCMYYYNQDWKKKKICYKCRLEKKWNNVGKLKVTDYEVPMEYVIPEVGGIDLLIDDKYAVEVKPEGSKETLVRMIAEILTYTAAIEEDYEPAICFFKNSQQMKDYKKYMEEDNEDLKYLIKYVSVFYISYRPNKEKNDVVDYEIKRIEV